MLVDFNTQSCVDITADQVYGDQDWHSVVRNQCLDYMVSTFIILYDMLSSLDLLPINT